MSRWRLFQGSEVSHKVAAACKSIVFHDTLQHFNSIIVWALLELFAHASLKVTLHHHFQDTILYIVPIKLEF